MSRISIHQNGKSFEKDGKPFFYLADTIWSAFTNVTIEEWEYYLEKRKNQGFNVLQINTLPQWDRCMSDVGVYPFETKNGILFSFDHYNEEFYDRAKQMCQMAVDYGFTLALVVLWLNYVPGTWGSRMNSNNIMPKDMVKNYTRKIFEEFDSFDPIYVISGDTDFDTAECISYYKTVLDTLCELSPDSLKTFHIKRGYDVIPEEFLNKIDFYMFQSGHNVTGQDMAYKLPEAFAKKYPHKPMINAEPCYEQMGYSRKIYGRFETFDLRKAAWSSILSGACAGITYGAHGIWNWYKINRPKNPAVGEGFDDPLPWEEAIHLPGAWDYGYIRQLFELLNVTYLIPRQDILLNKTDEIIAGESNQGDFFIYVPSNTNVMLDIEFSEYKLRVIDLETKNIACPLVTVKDKKTNIMLHRFLRDVLILIKK